MSATPTLPTISHRRQALFVAFLLWLLMIIALCIFFLREPNYVDDASYFQFAERIASISQSENPFHYEGSTGSANQYRLGFLIPTALSVKLFGYTIWGYYTIPLLFNSLLPVAVFGIGFLLGGISLGIAMALVIGSSPFFLEYSTILRVDAPSISLHCLALFLLLLGIRTKRGWLVVFAGFLSGWGLWMKEATLPFSLGTSIAPFFFQPDKRDNYSSIKFFLFFVLGGILLASIEFLTLFILTGDPLTRVRAILGGHVTGAKEQWIAKGLIASDQTWWSLLVRYPLRYASSLYGKTFLCLSVLGVLLAVLKRSTSQIFLLCLSLISFLFVSLAVTSVDPLVPLLRTKDRYFLTAAVPLFLLSLTSIYQIVAVDFNKALSKKKQSQSFAYALKGLFLVGALTLAAFSFIQESEKWYYVRNGADAMHQVARLVEQAKTSEMPFKRILSGARTTRVIDLYLSEKDSLKLTNIDYDYGSYIHFDQTAYYQPGDLVVLNLSRLRNNSKYFYLHPIPEFLESPPIHWQLLGSSKWRTFRIYRVHEPSQLSASRKEVPNLLSYLHAYTYKTGDGGVLEQRNKDQLTFTVTGGSDTRIVAPKGKYHKPPYVGADSPFAFESAASFSVRLGGTLEGDITFERGFIIEFPGRERRPNMIPLTVSRDGKKFTVEGTHSVRGEPAEVGDAKYSAPVFFRVMLAVSGEGRVNIDDFSLERFQF